MSSAMQLKGLCPDLNSLEGNIEYSATSKYVYTIPLRLYEHPVLNTVHTD
jgi:hypothetical protein